MSNETTQKRSLSVSLGAAFLMATSAIGPGFLTQTSQFTAKYLSSFAFVIVCVIIMDMIAQTNVWSIVGVSGLRGQEIANKVLPGLGYLLVVLVVLGGLAFNIGNVGGVSLGFNAMIGIPEKAGVIIGGYLHFPFQEGKRHRRQGRPDPRRHYYRRHAGRGFHGKAPRRRCGRPYLYP